MRILEELKSSITWRNKCWMVHSHLFALLLFPSLPSPPSVYSARYIICFRWCLSTCWLTILGAMFGHHPKERDLLTFLHVQRKRTLLTVSHISSKWCYVWNICSMNESVLNRLTSFLAREHSVLPDASLAMFGPFVQSADMRSPIKPTFHWQFNHCRANSRHDG